LWLSTEEFIECAFQNGGEVPLSPEDHSGGRIWDGLPGKIAEVIGEDVQEVLPRELDKLVEFVNRGRAENGGKSEERRWGIIKISIARSLKNIRVKKGR
jgi:hypothetical protein